MEILIAIIIFLIAMFISVLPAITAYQRKTKNRIQVLIVNLLLGWTIIGYIIALVMAYSPNTDVIPTKKN